MFFFQKYKITLLIYDLHKLFLQIKKTFKFAYEKKVGAIAQLVEQWTENPCVPSSNLGSTTSLSKTSLLMGFLFFKMK